MVLYLRLFTIFNIRGGFMPGWKYIRIASRRALGVIIVQNRYGDHDNQDSVGNFVCFMHDKWQDSAEFFFFFFLE